MSNSISEAIRAWLLKPVLDQLKQTEEKLMSALDDKTAAIVTAVTGLGKDLSALIDDLKANNGAPTAAQLQALDDIATSLTALDTQAKSADPGPQTTTAA